MNSVDMLEKTTFCGRRFTRRQLQEVQDTVLLFKNLSRKELAMTLCEHLKWLSPNGSHKIHSCYALLEKLEQHGMITLPAKRQTKAAVRKQAKIENPQDDHPIEDNFSAVSPIELQLVTTKEDRSSWKAYLQQYHYLGYKHAFGSHLGYFIVSRSLGQKLGCLLFSASAAWALEARDAYIGWEKKHRQKLLHLILSNDRFLIFPWIKVPNLASKALSLATKQVGDDWLQVYKYRPVMIETFVDTSKYSGGCYQAANWQYLGKTKGRGHFDPEHKCQQSIKDIYVYPLQPDWQNSLTNCHRFSLLKKKYRNDIQSSHRRKVDDAFVSLWENVVKIINAVASQYDDKWQIRKRLINSLLIILLIFRLVCSKNAQSYGTTIDELWDSCNRLNLPLPQKSSIAPSSFCAARRKLDEAAFKCINQRIIAAYQQKEQEQSNRWFGHRIFAVDGSKVNLPRSLISYGYKPPSDNANYPQGMLSCLYQLKSKIPYDFDLEKHSDERLCARQHLARLSKNDVVVYDRGYFSYAMLQQHYQMGIHAIFRLQESSYTVIREFMASPQTDLMVTIDPSDRTRLDILQKHPDLEIVPLQMRLIKYQLGEDTFCLGTTLADQDRYSIKDFVDVYHERWGIEELYKVSKRIFIIEDFHSQSERGVKQEIFAHFVLVTMNRILANQADDQLNPLDGTIQEASGQNKFGLILSKRILCKIKTNFKNCIHVFTRRLEELLLFRSMLKTTLEHTFRFIIGRHQKERPGRSFVRKSMRPETKWRPQKKSKNKKQISVAAELAVLS